MAGDNKPKFQPWNEEEFQADIYVRGMTALQRWMYRTLLQATFFDTHRPYLPVDDELLWILAGCESQEQWDENKAKVLRRFTAVDGRPDLMQNKRVVSDWENWQNSSDAQAEKGRARAAGAERVGGKFIPRVLIPAGTSQTPATAGGGWQNPPAGPATDQQEKRTEEKLKEEKLSELNSGGQAASSQTNPGSDWSNLRRLHRNTLGRKPDKSMFAHKYAAACETYGEEVVLACFGEWGPTAKDWVREKNVDHPLHAFFKKLPDMASEELADRDDRQAEAAQSVADAAKTQQELARREAQVVAARKADADKWDSMTKPSTENVVTLADYLEGQ